MRTCISLLSRVVLVLSLWVVQVCAADATSATDDFAKRRLCLEYLKYANLPSDINEHMPVLRDLAKECSSVVEIGLRTMVSSWGLLHGLAENGALERSYIGIDIAVPPLRNLELGESLSEGCGISFAFWQANDMDVMIPKTQLLFIDSLHTYCHLTYELETFSPQVSRYISMHDTSAPWGNLDDSEYHGNYSEYPAWIDRTKKGLWPAVEDFLSRHPEWKLKERRLNNHGFTVLERVSP